MGLPSSTTPRRRHSLAVLAALVAFVVAVTGFEASAHGHVPAVDGWHDEAPHGGTAHDDGLGSCSICRLAHETSSGPVAAGTVSLPLRWIAPRPQNRPAFTLVAPAREQQPRAPPCLASC
jgi:hypothetical protein